MNKAPLTVIVDMRTDAAQAERLRSILQDMVPVARAEAGCELYELYEAAENPAHFVFFEHWSDEKSLDAHTATQHFKRAADSIIALCTVPVSVTRYNRST
jgi:quinol monooxygenase YgiN